MSYCTRDGSYEARSVLITGGAGFIGSNLIRWLLSNVPRVVIINLDALTYAGNLENLGDVSAEHGTDGTGRYHFIRGDIRDAALVAAILRGDAIDAQRRNAVPQLDGVIHLAAESHVDRSILGSGAFVSTNVVGTHTLLEALRTELGERPRDFRFVNVSTDEVYGSLGEGDAPFTESHPLEPNSPYSASKAGADCLVRAYWEMFRLPVITTRCSNNYGPFQFPEKLIPLMITKALEHEALPIYGDGLNVRDWLHVEDHASGLWLALARGVPGRVYNFGGDAETTNLALVRMLLNEVARPESLISFVADRLGHDRRYAMDASRSKRELGWFPRHSLQEGIASTVAWYMHHRDWWKRVQTEAYRPPEQLNSDAGRATVP